MQAAAGGMDSPTAPTTSQQAPAISPYWAAPPSDLPATIGETAKPAVAATAIIREAAERAGEKVPKLPPLVDETELVEDLVRAQREESALEIHHSFATKDLESEQPPYPGHLKLRAVTTPAGDYYWIHVREQANVAELRKMVMLHVNDQHKVAMLRVDHDVLNDDSQLVASIPKLLTGNLEVLLTDAPMVAVGSSARGVYVYDPHSNHPMQTLGSSSHISVVAYNAKGTQLAAGDNHGYVRVWDAQSWEEDHVAYELCLPVRSLAWSSDGSLLAVGGECFAARVWHVGDQRELHRLEHPLTVSGVGFSPDGTHLLTGCHDDVARVWVLSARTEEHCLWHNAAVTCVAWNPVEAETVATGSEDFCLRVWEVAHEAMPSSEIHFISRQGASICDIRWNHLGSRIATCSRDLTVRVFTKEGKEEHRFQNPDILNSLSWDSTGMHLVAGGDGGRLQFFHVGVGASVEDYKEEATCIHGRIIYSVSWRPAVTHTWTDNDLKVKEDADSDEDDQDPLSDAAPKGELAKPAGLAPESTSLPARVSRAVEPPTAKAATLNAGGVPAGSGAARPAGYDQPGLSLGALAKGSATEGAISNPAFGAVGPPAAKAATPSFVSTPTAATPTSGNAAAATKATAHAGYADPGHSASGVLTTGPSVGGAFTDPDSATSASSAGAAPPAAGAVGPAGITGAAPGAPTGPAATAVSGGSPTAGAASAAPKQKGFQSASGTEAASPSTGAAPAAPAARGTAPAPTARAAGVDKADDDDDGLDI